MFVVESLTFAGPRESSAERHQVKRALSRKGCTNSGELVYYLLLFPGFFERNDTIVRAGRNSFSPVQVMAYWVL